ncbi:hypothetical protein Glove_99g107 [Diversispora epigaea]|uniref:Uncharacterized protein n=1 Tax=Diversispora epigaea TaxID=1348612 RepID=A0A397J8I3_9GLOM|nr:hypothetical protein Glove_99g107 [Diversispora epigaea]
MKTAIIFLLLLFSTFTFITAHSNLMNPSDDENTKDLLFLISGNNVKDSLRVLSQFLSISCISFYFGLFYLLVYSKFCNCSRSTLIRNLQKIYNGV